MRRAGSLKERSGLSYGDRKSKGVHLGGNIESGGVLVKGGGWEKSYCARMEVCCYVINLGFKMS